MKMNHFKCKLIRKMIFLKGKKILKTASVTAIPIGISFMQQIISMATLIKESIQTINHFLLAKMALQGMVCLSKIP